MKRWDLMKNIIALCIGYSKIFTKTMYVVFLFLPIVVVFVLSKEESVLMIVSGLFNFLILLTVAMIFLACFRHFYAQTASDQDSITDEIVGVKKAVAGDFLGVSALVLTLLFAISIYILIFNKISIAKGYQNNMVEELVVPMNYIIANISYGLPFLITMILRVLVYLVTIVLSCRVAFLELFERYKVLAAVFVFFILVVIYEKMLKWLNWFVLNSLGGIEFMTSAEVGVLLSITLALEIAYLIFLLLTSWQVIKGVIGRTILRRGVYGIKEAHM